MRIMGVLLESNSDTYDTALVLAQILKSIANEVFF